MRYHGRPSPFATRSASSFGPLAFQDRGLAPGECSTDPSRDSHVAAPVTTPSTAFANEHKLASEDNNTTNSSNGAEHNNNLGYRAVDHFCTSAISAGNRKNLTTADATIFSPYQPLNGSPYDLSSPFGRTNLEIEIYRRIAKCEDYLGCALRLYRDGHMPSAEYRKHSGERFADLRQHQRALSALNRLSGGRL